MTEEFEFRVDEELAGRLFADSEGEKLSVVRKVRLDATNPRMTFGSANSSANSANMTDARSISAGIFVDAIPTKKLLRHRCFYWRSPIVLSRRERSAGRLTTMNRGVQFAIPVLDRWAR